MIKTWTEEAEERGVAKGQRRVIRTVLDKKFGPLSPAAEQRLAEWPAERLDRLAADLLTAGSLRELGLED